MVAGPMPADDVRSVLAGGFGDLVKASGAAA
jgi:hypothetical protein